MAQWLGGEMRIFPLFLWITRHGLPIHLLSLSSTQCGLFDIKVNTHYYYHLKKGYCLGFFFFNFLNIYVFHIGHLEVKKRFRSRKPEKIEIGFEPEKEKLKKINIEFEPEIFKPFLTPWLKATYCSFCLLQYCGKNNDNVGTY